MAGRPTAEGKLMAGQTLRMPAEWEPQTAMWLTWPANLETWPDNLLAAQIEFTALVHSLSEMVAVRVLVNPPDLETAYDRLIQPDIRNVGLINIPTDDAWARDYSPTFVVSTDDELVAIDWDYNAWGGKYPPFENDRQVAQKIANGLSIAIRQPGLCFEGGAIETNGDGVVISTVSCAADPNRNAGSPDQLLQKFETAFANFLGAQATIWLPGEALAGDDTDGHIDQLARFVNRDAIVYAWCDVDDPQRPALAKNLSALQAGIRKIETDVQLHPLPIPAQRIELFGRRVPASYCNFLIANELVVVPQFGCREDRRALDILGELFPDYYVLGLPSGNLSVGLGSFHCLSQQQPQLAATAAG